MSLVHALCLCCGEPSEWESDAGPPCCPHCLCSVHVPADLDDMATVTLTVHELRVLTMWADKWAHSMPDLHSKRVVTGIVDRLVPQLPGGQSLTIDQLVSDLASRFPDFNFEIQRPGDAP